MIPFIGLLIGAIIGGIVGQDFGPTVIGAIVGLVVGFIVRAQRKKEAPAVDAHTAITPDSLEQRLVALDARLSRIEGALERAGIRVAVPTTAAAAAAATPAEIVAPVAPPPPIVETKTAPAELAERAPVGEARDETAVPPTPVYGAARDAKPNAIWAWITGGNTLARVGVLVLFVGVGFLLKYAAEHVTVPIELRVAGVALGGIVLLVLGWRLRDRRSAYAMILQGGGVGVLYLTVFAGLKLYALVPPTMAFALLLLIAALSSWLAIKQDAIALAAVGVIGGFLAPILTSSGAGNHVLLFSYYAILNAAVLFIAWFKAWRLLNLLGFVCTFVIGTVWGVTRYRASDFATTEPFLILFFLFYVAIAVLYAVKQSIEVRHYVDGTIVFGTPLVAAGLQQALVRNFEFGMAMSAVAASALYLVLARVLWARRRDDLRLLVESFLALGVVFATLAIPLAFDARWTSATWALEGGAIVWIGVRQQRLLARIFGLLLQLAAGAAFVLGWASWIGHPAMPSLPILNSDFIGAVLVAVGGVVSAWAIDRNRDLVRSWERPIAVVALVWGTAWWFVAGIREIDRFIRYEAQLSFVVALVALTGFAYGAVSRKLQWRLARQAARFTLPILTLCALAGIGNASDIGGHLFANVGFFAWAFALVASFELLRMFDRDGTNDLWPTRVGHAAFVIVIALIVAEELAWLGREYVDPQSVWHVVGWGIAPSAALIVACALARRPWWPVAVHKRSYLVSAPFVLLGWMALFALIANIAHDGGAAPLPFVPIANPLDLTLALIAIAVAFWALTLGRDHIDIDALMPREVVYAVPAALAFVWANAIVLRTIHHWYDVPWDGDAMWHSTVVQAALSILWTIIALAAMVVANRNAWRIAWITGAALLAIVVVKLFIIDLSRIGGIERIVSFIGVGLLLLLIGYLAPVPPRRKEEAS